MPRVSFAPMRKTTSLVALIMVAVTGAALAQPAGAPTERRAPPPPAPTPAPPPTPPPAFSWDSRGWQMLGEQQVSGNVDKDRITVGRYEGKFSKLTLVVLDSDLEMLEFKIVFADRTTFDPKVSQFFRENQRTRVIDLPPSENVIQRIDLKYRNLPGGGRAKVQVWGFKTGTTPPPVPPPAPAWDSRGWQMLGEQQVSGNVDKDRITVGRYEGKFSKLTLVVLDSDLEMLEFKIVFADRTTFDPKVSQFFRENQRTRVIDLPPSENVIQRIDLKYRNLPGGGRAKVQVWGFKTGTTPPPPIVWDSKGWTKLGERDVNGSVDKDRIEVGRYEGKFTKLTIVVRDSDLEMLDFAIKFGKGPEWRPANVNHYFRENQRTRVIDFPGDERVIKYIDFKYRNLPGGGRAKVEVWGQLGGGKDSKPTAFTWDQKGWTMLGERTVNGRADKDRIDVGREEGKFRRLTVVVLDSDLAMVDMEIKFGRGPTFRPDVKQDFREGSRTRVIDLPGDDRVIKWIEFKYKNLPGGGNAKVQVWAK